MEVFRVSLAMILGMALPFAIQLWDRSRLPPDRRAVWNTATWGAVIYGLGPFSMIGWIWMTRQRWRAWRKRSWPFALVRSAALLVAGALASVLVYAAIVAVYLGVGALGGAHDFDDPSDRGVDGGERGRLAPQEQPKPRAR